MIWNVEQMKLKNWLSLIDLTKWFNSTVFCYILFAIKLKCYVNLSELISFYWQSFHKTDPMKWIHFASINSLLMKYPDGRCIHRRISHIQGQLSPYLCVMMQVSSNLCANWEFSSYRLKDSISIFHNIYLNSVRNYILRVLYLFQFLSALHVSVSS